MVTVRSVARADDTLELEELVNRAAEERGCELDGESSYEEAAEWLESEAPKAGNGEEGMLELAEILKAAEAAWYKLN